MKPVIIMGGGLSGLACAVHLHRKGVPAIVLEAQAQVGGRVASIRTDQGFLVDQGFQVLLDSYPELEAVESLSSLELQAFHSGALIFNGNSLDLLANPFRHPFQIAKTLTFPHVTLKDSALVVSLMLYAQRVKSDEYLGEVSTLEFLRAFGFSEVFVENFWRPFLAGVYLDQELTLGKDFFLFLLKCFAWGKVCLPQNGMQELPLQMARQLPEEHVRVHSKVKSWTEREVVLCDGQRIEASHVVCAFDTRAASQSDTTLFRAVTTHYFTSPLLSQLGWDKWLILIPQHLGMTISHMALVSSVASSYGNSGQPLLSVSIVGRKKSDISEIIPEIERLAGRTLHLSWITTTEIPRALPVVRGQTSGFEFKDGIFYCGDQYASPSINGALRSGRLLAEFMMSSHQGV